MDATKLPPLAGHRQVHRKHVVRDFFTVVGYVLLLAAAGVAVGVHAPKLVHMEPFNGTLSAITGALFGLILGIGKIKSMHRDYRKYGTYQD